VPTPDPLKRGVRVGGAVGVRRRRGVSGYVVRAESSAPVGLCPAARRQEARGYLAAVQRRLGLVRVAVMNGATLVESVADGTVVGWHARMALDSTLDGGNLLAWDSRPGRTVRDRLWLVQSTLARWGINPGDGL